MHAKSLQSRPTLCNPMDCSLPGSSVHGILQARILEWVAMPSSRGSLRAKDQIQVCKQILYHLSHQGSPRILEWVVYPFSRGSSRPRDLTQVSHTTGGFFFLPAGPPGKPKNTGVGSLSLLQGIFPTQGSNQGLLHCGWILYQLSHKGSPRILEWVVYPFTR